MYEKELKTALFAANSARKVVLDVYYSNDIGVEIKSDNSPVTKADKASDKLIREILSKEFPSYSMLTEESSDDKTRLQNDYVWTVDPVDGTKEFVSKNGEFTINIGLSYKHEAVLGVVLAPVSGKIYYAVKGLGSFYMENKDAEPVRIHANEKLTGLTALCSRFHANADEDAMIEKHSDKISTKATIGAALKGCAIAEGSAEISYRFSSMTKEWDTCAMQVIVEQSGAHLLKLDGTPIRYNREDVFNRGGYVICNRIENFLL